MEDDKSSKVTQILNDIKETDNAIETATEEAQRFGKEKQEVGPVSEKKRKLEEFRNTFEGQIANHRKELEFFHNTDECPTCQQGIEHDHKSLMTQRDEEKISELEKALQELNTQYSEVELLVTKVQELDEQIMAQNNEVITQQRIPVSYTHLTLPTKA